MREPLLVIQDLDVAYGSVQVLFGVTLEVGAGEIVAIIGPNGAGKSTVIKSVVGLSRIRRGSIRFLGQELSRIPPHQIAGLGIGYVPQGRIVFARMTVRENLEMGAFLIRDSFQFQSALDLVFSRFPRLYERREQLAGSLSGGEQQMLAIGRALMLKPRLIVLDEPSLGLSPKLVEMIFDELVGLRDEGRTLLMVEQNAARALTLADRAYVLELGHNRHQGAGSSLLRDPEVRKMYLGG